MAEDQYKLILLEIDRSFLAVGTPETDKLQNALRRLKEKGIGIMLIVPGANQELGEVHVIGYFGGTMTTYRRCLITSLMADMQVAKGIDIVGDDILYLADSDAARDPRIRRETDIIGREHIENWCQFENVGKGCEGLNAKLGEIFGNGIFGEKNAKAQLPKPKPPKQERFPKLNRVLRALHLAQH